MDSDDDFDDVPLKQLKKKKKKLSTGCVKSTSSKKKSAAKPDPAPSSSGSKKRKSTSSTASTSSSNKKVKKEATSGGKGVKKELKKLDKGERLQYAMQSFLWWDAAEPPEGCQWSTMEHAGVSFPEPYLPHGIKMKYDGKPIELSPVQEEA
jgi:DNA topoisomerase-1